jgi:hypothetical protein
MSVASSIIKHLEQLGYAVSTHDLRDYVEMHAVKLPAGEPPHLVARVDDVGPEAEERCACELARMCGVQLEDG